MKNKQFIISAIAATVIFLTASIASAVPGAFIVYNETDLGGSWQYDYTIFNVSTEGEAIHEVFLYFTGNVTVTGTSLPAGWHGIPWTGTYTISYLNAYSTDFTYDIVAWDSIVGFSFIVDYRAGNILYDAYFSGDKQISGTTAVCLFSFYRDTDGDGYGNPEDTLQACLPPEGYVFDNTDCDDTDPEINPNTVWYQDNDGDGYGTYSLSLQQCVQPSGPPDYVLNDIDYDDSNPSVGPPTRINGGTPSYYLSLQEAYNTAADGDTIQCVDVTFTENLTIHANKSVTFEGGYDGSYATIAGITTLQGDITVSGGTLNIENFKLLQ